MSESFIRRGLFQAVLKRAAPIFLAHADESIRDEALEILTEGTKQESRVPADLDTRMYHTWLRYVNFDLNERYGSFKDAQDTARERRAGERPVLSTSVVLTKRLKIFGKSYSVQSICEGNSSVEYRLRGKSCFGRIQKIFRTPVIATEFLCIEPFTELSDADATKNFYANYPGLLATIRYEEPAECVVIDVQDLISHITFLKNPSKSFDIVKKTVSIVSLKHAVSCLYTIIYLYLC